MPRLSAFYGIVVYMYIRDHGVGHVHARHGGNEGVFEISTGALIAGSLKPRQAALVREWISRHTVELGEAWEKASAGEPPGTIEPLP
jgi:Domain of unknown function (DUF4160)